MNRSTALVGIALCAILLFLDSSGIVDLGYFAYGLMFIILGLGTSVLVSVRSVKDDANG
ncbi:hypothetical protein JN10_1793 [Altererythrobacter ishigakiensis]|uniref:Uncharacterized protein n=1 Tax=Altererythrobacter ishigakiensis TaxID=476157 RepID=A0A562UWW4_9SPHN|nr:hypothetical protein JN10_1793 [Altererythrobacter ishigakiensis]